MKKISIFVIFLGLILSGCAGGIPNLASLLATPTVPTPVDTPTALPTVTLIPTSDLFAIPSATPVTFTPTETSSVPATVVIPPTSTPLPLPTYSDQFINDVTTNTFFVQNAGFRAILYSDAVLYWNQGPCTPRSIKMTAFVEDPARTARVYLFLRLHDKNDTLKVGEWSSGAQMIKIDDGSFNYKFDTDNLRRFYFYKEAWIEYQLVATNDKLEILGRTQLYDHNLTLRKCGSFSSP